MNGLQIPLPPGLAGASPGALGGAGDILGGAMQTQGVPPRQPTGATGGQPWWYSSPDVMDYVASMTATGYDAAVAMEALEYQAQRDDADRAQTAELAQAELNAAIEAANIAAGASRAASAASAAATTEAARTHAEAQKYAADQALAAATERAEAARYAADQALEGVRIDAETRMKIAAGNLRLESQKVAAQEFGAPSDWIKQVGFLRGMGMTREDITPQAIRASGEALGPGPPELGPPQAVVGETGPELATATPQGTQMTPLDPTQAYHLRGQGVPAMQYGGTVGRLGQTTGGYSSPYRAQQAVGGSPYTPTGQKLGTSIQHNIPGAAYASALGPGGTAVFGRGGGAAMYGAGGEYFGSHGRGSYHQRMGQIQEAARQRLGLPGPEPAPEEMPAWFAQWLETQGGAAAPGTAPAEGGAAVPGATPGAPTGPADANKMPFLETLRTGGYVPLYEAWGGPTTLPEAGITDPVKMPHEYNYADFARWTPTEQSMMFATWQALGMEPTTALEIMRRSAPRGSAGAAVGYG